MPMGRAVRLRFSTKVILLVVGLSGSMLLSDILVMRVAVRDVVNEQSGERLDVGARVWQSLREARSRQLVEQVAVFSDDFGFKEAVATHDLPTLQSVLRNASSRLGLPFALLLSVEGEPIASLDIDAQAIDAQRLTRLLARAREQGAASGVVVIAGAPVSFALVPVFAPHQVGWLAMGGPFGAADLAELVNLTGLDAALTWPIDERWQLLDQRGERRPVDADYTAPLRDAGARISLPSWSDNDDAVLALAVAEPGFTPLYLLIAAPTERLMRPFDSLQQRALAWTLAVTVLALLVAFAFGRVLQQRVRHLADAAERIRAGRDDQPLALSGQDELRELADTFNLMQAGISEREQQIVFSSGHDSLTRLPNRERAISLLTQRLATPIAAGQCALLMVIEIRRFRDVNDLLGFAFGDQALIAWAQRLRAMAREGDPLARLGGDEFLLSIWNIPAEQAERRVKQIAASLAESFEIDAVPLNLEFNLGAVTIDVDSDVEASVLLRRADIAMYEAKQTGETLVFYQQGLDERHQRQLQLVSHMAEGYH